MLKDLEIYHIYEQSLQLHANNPAKAMTAAVVTYLETQYAN